jgi:hypothetical protein
MIKNDFELEQALHSIELMEKSLEKLREDVQPKSEQRFQLMAEGPRDEIKKLRREVEDYYSRQHAKAG